MVFPQFSPARTFGTAENLEFFITHGYETGAFGRGEWVGDKRIVAIWVLKGPGVPIRALYHPKIDEAGMNLRGPRREKEFASEQELDEFLDEWKVSIFGDGVPLEKLLEDFLETQALQMAGELQVFLSNLYPLEWEVVDDNEFVVWLFRHSQKLAEVHYDGKVCGVLYYEETMPTSEAELLSEVLRCKFDFERTTLSIL